MAGYRTWRQGRTLLTQLTHRQPDLFVELQLRDDLVVHDRHDPVEKLCRRPGALFLGMHRDTQENEQDGKPDTFHVSKPLPGLRISGQCRHGITEVVPANVSVIAPLIFL